MTRRGIHVKINAYRGIRVTKPTQGFITLATIVKSTKPSPNQLWNDAKIQTTTWTIKLCYGEILEHQTKYYRHWQ